MEEAASKEAPPASTEEAPASTAAASTGQVSSAFVQSLKAGQAEVEKEKNEKIYLYISSLSSKSK